MVFLGGTFFVVESFCGGCLRVVASKKIPGDSREKFVNSGGVSGYAKITAQAKFYGGVE